jgi:hypothetical protein
VSALPDLMRRIDRKLDIQRGLSLSYDDLALLVASGAYPLVYFIQAGNSGPIKIGRTKNAQQRKHHLQLATHHDLTLLAAFKAPFWAEGQLHHFYTQERIRGEWYRPSPRLLRYIEELTA